jgi:prepilin-type N-terminal cleavage/methylation domain-containing protein/prepilin-type processing-associated H-X9-DG protein
LGECSSFTDRVPGPEQAAACDRFLNVSRARTNWQFSYFYPSTNAQQFTLSDRRARQRRRDLAQETSRDTSVPAAANNTNGDCAMRQRGFTLVELLVVIAIIGILVALLLPAVQAAREAARRMQCLNQIKQLALALHNYHDVAKKFPPGAISDPNPAGGTSYGRPPRTTYIVHLMPYIEQNTVYDTIDFVNRPVAPGLCWFGNNAQATGATMPLLYCPSDGMGGVFKTCGLINGDANRPAPHFLSNYMAFFSGFTVASIETRDARLVAAFGLNRGASFADILDGTSNTMLMGEYLTGTTDDYRGFIWSDKAGGSQLWTELPPNSKLPDRLSPTTPPPPLATKPWCKNRPEVNLPCVNGISESSGLANLDHTAASRSRHPGGVQVLLGDGSVRFVGQTIDLRTWRALSTIQAGEVLGEY